MIGLIIDNLLDTGEQIFHPNDISGLKKEIFSAVLESVSWQYYQCGLYQHFCKSKKYFPPRDLTKPEEYSKIPYFTTSSYKKFGGISKQLLMVPEGEIRVWSLSRGTSRDSSMIGRDQDTLDRMIRGFRLVFREILQLPQYKWEIIFSPPFSPQGSLTTPALKLPHINWWLEQLFPPPQNGYCFGVKLLDPNARNELKKFGIDIERMLQILPKHATENTPGVIFGLTAAFSVLLDAARKEHMSFALHPDTKVITFGGWFTYGGQIINPEKFRTEISQLFHIAEKNIRDIYTFTETDVMFVECEHHRKHVPPWADVIIRDVETLIPINNGEKGLLNIINPLSHSYAGVSILIDDMVRIFPDPCPCGRYGKTIEVFSRAR
jgi:long-chain-fatty-acid---luciferin-component ligase